MKTRSLILSTLIMIILSSFANAWELSLQPSDWKYSPWCMIWIDIAMDPKWEQISATDLVIESSMQFVKFEATKLFPYFFPPKTIDSIVHIVWFTSWPSQWINTKWIIWKIYFKQKNKSDLDWNIKFYFKKIWDTTDTNLSIGWWIDILQNTQNWFYTFNGTECDYPEKETIVQKTSNIDFEESLEQTMKKVEKDYVKAQRKNELKKLQKFLEGNKIYIISLFIVIIILVAYFKIFKWKFKKK